MSVDQLQQQQHIDDALMESLEQIDTPASDPARWFPVGHTKLSPRPDFEKETPEPAPQPPQAEAKPVQPAPPEATIPEIAPGPAATPTPPPAAPTITHAPKQTVKTPRAGLLYLPAILFLLLSTSSITAQVLELPFIPSGVETLLYVVLALAFIPGTTLIALRQAARLRETYHFAGPDTGKRALHTDISLALMLGSWVVATIALITVLLLAVPSDQEAVATFTGLSVFWLLTGPLSLLLSLLLIVLALTYRRGNNIDYPGFIYTAMDWSQRIFERRK